MRTVRDNEFGINDIGIYIPSPRIAISSLVKRRVYENPNLQRHLDRACRTTGQRAIRFSEPWEDAATMAAQAASDMIRRNPEINPGTLRHLAVGTESGVDHSKPLSSYVLGMLQRAGVGAPSALSSFQAQHACAGGTMAMLSAGGLLAAAGKNGDTGLVISTDVAHYETGTTAEVTQGAGAAALHLGLEPRLLEIDLSSIGYHSVDVDDFFRPLGQPIAQVRGTYSMQCYWDGLEAAFRDHCGRIVERPEKALADIDLFALHTPFRNMPETALQRLFQSVLGMDAKNTMLHLEERGFQDGVDPIADIGNLYTGSLWTVLAHLLAGRYRAVGEEIVGKKVMLASYGSGNTMIVMSGRVTEGAPKTIARWNLDSIRENARDATFAEYDAWTEGMPEAFEYKRIMDRAEIPEDAFVLSGIREDGYREYGKSEHVRDWFEEREASYDLHGSLALQH
jgi:hydroxymethylglutaryl-CoA synthase